MSAEVEVEVEITQLPDGTWNLWLLVRPLGVRSNVTPFEQFPNEETMTAWMRGYQVGRAFWERGPLPGQPQRDAQGPRGPRRRRD